MANILTVTKPFFVMEAGDTLELSENGTYVSNYSESYDESDENNTDISATYNSKFEISQSCASRLIKSGYLTETVKSSFTNVFDEIERLTKTYNGELDNIENDYAELPTCLKVEKETVLTNILKVLDHLHSLKK